MQNISKFILTHTINERVKHVNFDKLVNRIK
jgi:hypothetical protein